MFIIILIWELMYMTVLYESFCKFLNMSVKSFGSALMMLPFFYNVRKIYMNFPEDLQQVSLAEWTRVQLRNGVITFVLKAFQDILGEKGCVAKRKEEKISMISDTFISSDEGLNASLISESEIYKNTGKKPKEELKFCVDTSDREHYIEINNETVISDYLSDVIGRKNKQRDTEDTIIVIEASPKIYQELRDMQGILSKDILEALCVKKYKEGKMSVTIHKYRDEEKLMIVPHDSKLVLKTMTDSDYRHLQENIAAYYNHMKTNPENLLNPVLGVFTVQLPKTLCMEPMHFFLTSLQVKPFVPGHLRFVASVFFF